MSNFVSQKENVHLAIAFDNNYSTLCYVLLTSIFENNRTTKFCIHAIATDVAEVEKQEIKEFVTRSSNEIQFYTIPKEAVTGTAILKNSHITIAAYYRLFFPSLVPAGIKKLLYLDVDIIVIDNLEELYNTDISPYAVGAVVDSNMGLRPELGIRKENSYFNSGVLLINTEVWHQENITQKAFAFLQQHPEKIRYEDQDALNGVLVDKWFSLNKKYNITKFDIPAALQQKDYKTFLSDKVIIHYTNGRDKPWRILNKNKLRFLYYEYLKKSPRKFEPMYKDLKLKPNIIYHFCKIRMAEFLLSYPLLYQATKKANFYIRELSGIGNKPRSKKNNRVLKHS